MKTYNPYGFGPQIVGGIMSALLLLGSPPLYAHDGEVHEAESEDAIHEYVQDIQSLTQTLIATTPIIKQPVPSQSSRTRQASPAISKNITDAKVKAKNAATLRKEKMVELAKLDPQQFLNMAITPEAKKKLPADIQADVEQSGTFEGTTKVIHFDDFNDPKNSKFKYFLQSGGKEYEFLSPSALPPLESGATVKVTGYRLADVVVAPVAVNTFKVMRRAPPPESVGNQKTLVLLMTYQNASGPLPFTKEEAYQRIFKGPMQEFYKEQSYRKTSFSGDVFGWVTVPKDSDANTCGAGIVEDAKSIIADPTNNIDLAKYKRLIVVGNKCGMGFSSLGITSLIIRDKTFRISTAVVGIPSSGSLNNYGRPFSGFDHILIHELGHSLGLMHASVLECGPGIISSNPSCYHAEGGNGYDIMGIADKSFHFNAFYKEQLGWLDRRKDVLDIKKSGRYSLRNLEPAGGTPKLAKIYPLGLSDPFLSLEHRTAFGFDYNLESSELTPNQNGLFINQIVHSISVFSRLLDMTPTTNEWRNDLKDATLNVGKTFSDEEMGITIKTTAQRGSSERASEIFFDVDLKPPQCVRGTPSLVARNFFPWSPSPGESISVNASIQNNDSIGCGRSIFEVSLGSLHQITAYQPNASLELKPGEIGWSSGMRLLFNENIALGPYTIPIFAKNISTGEEFQISSLTITVIRRPSDWMTITSPSQAETWRQGSIHKITWTGGFNSFGADTSSIALNLVSNDTSNTVFNLNLSSTTNDRVESIIIPSYIPPGSYKMNLYCYGGNSGCTENRRGFSYTTPFSITITEGPPVSISGRASYDTSGGPIEGATLSLQNTATTTSPLLLTTNESGSYSFFDLPQGQNWALTPLWSTSGTHSTAITPEDGDFIDIVISAIEGGSMPITAIQARACDVNNDGTIDTTDSVLLHQYIADPSVSLPVVAQKGWWAFEPAMIHLNAVSSPQEDQNFKGLLYGDCNRSGFSYRTNVGYKDPTKNTAATRAWFTANILSNVHGALSSVTNFFSRIVDKITLPQLSK